MTMRSKTTDPPACGQAVPFQVPRFLHDPAEDLFDGAGAGRTAVALNQARQHLALPFRVTDLAPLGLLDLANLHCILEPLVYQLQQSGIHLVDAGAPVIQIHAPLLRKTHSPAGP